MADHPRTAGVVEPHCDATPEIRYPTCAQRFPYVDRILLNASERRSEHQSRGSRSVHEFNDADLASALAEGNEDALAELYGRYRRLAYVIALRIVHDPGTAEDVVQDAFLKLWNNAMQFAADRGSLRTWLITTVRNSAIDRLRGRAAHERAECELKPGLKARGATLDSSREVSVLVERTHVREALDSLPLEQRLVVELAYFGNYTQPEIAGMMGVPLGTVKGRTRLGLKKLSGLLDSRNLD